MLFFQKYHTGMNLKKHQAYKINSKYNLKIY